MNTLLLAGLIAAAPAAAAPKAPDFAVETLLNAPRKSVTLKDLKGKVVYLEFWATWCAPCVAGIPRTNRLIDKLADTDAVFLFVTDEPEEAVRSFLGKREVKAWIGCDPKKKALGPYRVNSRPQGFLIGRDGTLLAYIYPDMLTEKDVRDALAGTFKPRPIEWEKGERAPAKAGEKPLFELTLSPQAEKPERRRMIGGNREMAVEGIPFAPTLGWIWDIPSERIILDTEPARGFDMRLSVSRPEQMGAARELLKNAVQTTYGIKVLEESREADVYLLRRTGDGKTPPRPEDLLSKGSMSSGPGRLLTRDEMPGVAESLYMAVRRPVIDETALKGEYLIDLEWPEEDEKARDAALAAIGLKLVPARRKVPFLRVVAAP